MKKKKFSTKALSKQIDKWTNGYYSSGYKTKQSSYSNSSFWLDEDFLSSDGVSKEDKKSNDLIKLAAYKRAVANFVKIVTNKDNIPVKFSSGDNSYTDGNTVVISAKLSENEFDSTVGLALHEGSHIALTDFKFSNYYFNWNNHEGFIKLFDWHKATFPKQVVYESSILEKIKPLINIIEDRRIDHFVYKSAPGYQGYYRSLYDKYFNAESINLALSLGLKNENTFDDYLFHITNLANPNRQLNTLPGLQAIWNLIDLPNIGRLKSTQDVVEVAEEVFKTICLHIGGIEAENDPTGTDPEGTQSEPNPGNEDSNDIGNDSGDDDSDDNGMDPNLDINGTSSSGGGQDVQASTKQLTPKDLKTLKDLEDDIQNQKDFIDGKIKKKKLTKSEQSKIEAISEANINYKNTGGGQYECNDVQRPLANTQCIVAKGIHPSMWEESLLDGHCRNPEDAKAYMLKWQRKDFVNEGIILGTLLGKRLKTRDEERSTKNTRMETGRIDRRLVAELGFGNDHVFSQVLHKTVTPALIHISLDASGSMTGDKWHSAMKTAIAIAKAASMIRSLDCVISVRGSLRSNPLMWIIYDSRTDKFDSVKNKFYAVNESGSTPEGLCYQAVLDEIIKSARGKDAYFINICDGEPGYSNKDIQYHGSVALNHTRTQVEKMRKAGIHVLSYFVHGGYDNESSKKKHTQMYGKDGQTIDLDNLTQLSTSINKLFERGV